MAYLVGKTSIDIISDDAVDIRENLPVGFYFKLESAPMRGFYLEKTDYNTTHGKIYGKSDMIASHVADAYEKSNRSLGVLFSGGKGLGKSLTTRLVIEKLINNHAVIIINKYIDGMFEFLEPIKNAIYLFDEFEKTMRGNVNEHNDNNSTTKQDQILTFLDGTASGTHNLFLFTVNDKRELNDNLLSRPGRIRYHYQFESCDADTIRSYCRDNLKKPELESEVVNTLTVTRYVSLDIVRAIVDELNDYDVTVNEAMNYLNIDFQRINLQAHVTWMLGDVQKTYMISMGSWIPGNHEVKATMESHDEDDDDGQNNYWYLCLHINMDGKTIPLVGSLNVTKSTFIDYLNGAKPKIVNVELLDEDNAKFERFKPAGVDL